MRSMRSEDYIKLVKRTESPTFGDVNQRIMHGVIGCVTEAGEMMDAMKKCLFYGRTLDKDNLKEEIGDVFWYLGILCDELGVTFEEIQSMNIRKLRKRYPHHFRDVVERDYEGEMEAAKEPDKPIDQQASQLPKCFGTASQDEISDQKCFGCLSRGPCMREALQHLPPKEEERPVPRCWD